MKPELILDQYIRKDVSVNVDTPKNRHKVWLSNGLILNKLFFEYINDPIALYLLFRSREIRGTMKTPLYKRLHAEYYENGYIVCALSFSQIEKITGWFRSKITRYIKALVDRRWVRVDKIDVGKKEKQNIYLLGRLNNIGDDIYFIDEMVNSSQK